MKKNTVSYKQSLQISNRLSNDNFRALVRLRNELMFEELKKNDFKVN